MSGHYYKTVGAMHPLPPPPPPQSFMHYMCMYMHTCAHILTNHIIIRLLKCFQHRSS